MWTVYWHIYHTGPHSGKAFFQLATLLHSYEPSEVQSIIDWNRAKAMPRWAYLQSHPHWPFAKLATSEISISSSLKCFGDVTLSTLLCGREGASALRHVGRSGRVWGRKKINRIIDTCRRFHHRAKWIKRLPSCVLLYQFVKYYILIRHGVCWELSCFSHSAAVWSPHSVFTRRLKHVTVFSEQMMVSLKCLTKPPTPRSF